MIARCAAPASHAVARSMQRLCIGRSMAPTVAPGEEVHLAPGRRRPHAGDAVVFASAGGEEVLHRFVFKLPLLPYFVHRGDAAGAHVGLARYDRIVGVASLSRRRPPLRDFIAGAALVARRLGRRLLRT